MNTFHASVNSLIPTTRVSDQITSTSDCQSFFLCLGSFFKERSSFVKHSLHQSSVDPVIRQVEEADVSTCLVDLERSLASESRPARWIKEWGKVDDGKCHVFGASSWKLLLLSIDGTQICSIDKFVGMMHGTSCHVLGGSTP